MTVELPSIIGLPHVVATIVGHFNTHIYRFLQNENKGFIEDLQFNPQREYKGNLEYSKAEATDGKRVSQLGSLLATNLVMTLQVKGRDDIRYFVSFRSYALKDPRGTMDYQWFIVKSEFTNMNKKITIDNVTVSKQVSMIHSNCVSIESFIKSIAKQNKQQDTTTLDLIRRASEK
jgi:hypothetical protein